MDKPFTYYVGKLAIAIADHTGFHESDEIDEIRCIIQDSMEGAKSEIDRLKADNDRLRNAMDEHRMEAKCRIDPCEGGPGEYEFIDDCGSVCAECHNRELCLHLSK